MRLKEKDINLVKLKRESCSKTYFDLAYKRKKADNLITEENKILMALARRNYIKIEKEVELYESISIQKDTKVAQRRRKSKEELKREMLQAIEDVK